MTSLETERTPSCLTLRVSAFELRRIDPVVDRPNALRRREPLVAHELRDVLRDGDPARRHATDHAPRAAEWLAPVEVRGRVHRRNGGHPRNERGSLSVHVSVDEMGVHDVRAERADLGEQGRDEQRIHVRSGRAHGDVDVGGAQVVDEEVAAAAAEDAHPDVDAFGREGGEEREQVTFGPTDPLCPLDVEDSHPVGPQSVLLE